MASKENPNKKKPSHRKFLQTNTGHKLTSLEAKFIDEYIATGNARQSVIQAGYKTSAPGQYATCLFNKHYISEEIAYRLEQLHNAKVADAAEVMEYFTSVMRGEIKDQFGLEAPLSERTKAAQEIAKRTVDVEARMQGKQDAEIVIKLDWQRNDEGNN